MMELLVNGEEWRVDAGLTVADVVARLTGSPSGIAVAVDGAVVPRARWGQTPLHPGARVEVLTAVQGG
jgi:sulfur carrier protein